MQNNPHDHRRACAAYSEPQARPMPKEPHQDEKSGAFLMCGLIGAGIAMAWLGARSLGWRGWAALAMIGAGVGTLAHVCSRHF